MSNLLPLKNKRSRPITKKGIMRTLKYKLVPGRIECLEVGDRVRLKTRCKRSRQFEMGRIVRWSRVFVFVKIEKSGVIVKRRAKNLWIWRKFRIVSHWDSGPDPPASAGYAPKVGSTVHLSAGDGMRSRLGDKGQVLSVHKEFHDCRVHLFRNGKITRVKFYDMWVTRVGSGSWK